MATSAPGGRTRGSIPSPLRRPSGRRAHAHGSHRNADGSATSPDLPDLNGRHSRPALARNDETKPILRPEAG